MNRLQGLTVENSRLGIPFISGRDIIHGHLTVFPIPLVRPLPGTPNWCKQAAVPPPLNPPPMGFIGRFRRWWMYPDPRWGRMAESYGESALLNADLGVAAVRGYLSDDLSAEDAIAACAKHFAGYGAAEGGAITTPPK